jgi:hypothetical protein
MVTSSEMQKLEQQVTSLSDLNAKLLLLVSSLDTQASSILHLLGAKMEVSAINLSLELSGKLAAIPRNNRALMVSEILKEIAFHASSQDLLLLENIEILFEPSLQIDPLDTLRKLAHSRRVVAVWPGELRGDRLVYADMSHPEHRDYSREGVVVLEI